MSSFATHVGIQAVCPHMGTISVTPGQPRVKVSSQPVATMADTFPIAGCPFQIPSAQGPSPSRAFACSGPSRDARALGGAAMDLATEHGHVPQRRADPQGPPRCRSPRPA